VDAALQRRADCLAVQSHRHLIDAADLQAAIAATGAQGGCFYSDEI